MDREKRREKRREEEEEEEKRRKKRRRSNVMNLLTFVWKIMDFCTLVWMLWFVLKNQTINPFFLMNLGLKEPYLVYWWCFIVLD